MANKYLIQLDGLRTIAVGLVIFSHYASLSGLREFNFFLGATGVNLFFVLSGFLITSILISTKYKQETEGYSSWFVVKQFYARRFLRIFPLYYLVIALGIIFNIPNCRENIVSLLTYTSNWILPHQNDLKSYAHMWSLGVEEQYYIVFPMIFIFIKSKHIKSLIIGMITLAVLSRIFIGWYFFSVSNLDELSWAANKMTPACLDAFGFGAFLAFLKFYYPEKAVKILTNNNAWLLALIFALASFATWMYADTNLFIKMFSTIFNRTFMSVASVYIIGLAAFSKFTGNVGSFLENKIVVYLGKISYGIYVYHFIILHLFDNFELTGRLHLDLLLGRLIALILTITISCISWAIYERPFNDLKRFFPYTSNKPKLVPQEV